MSDINCIILVGRLTKDPVIRNTTSGNAIAEFSLASNRKYKDKEEVAYVDVTVFGKLAEIIRDHKHKGDQVCVSGRLRTEKWDDKDGKPKQKNSIVAETVQFLQNAKANRSAAAENEGEDDGGESGFTNAPPAEEEGEPNLGF